MAISSAHAEWLESRGLDIEIAAKFGVTSRGPFLAWPYLKNGQEIYAKQRNTREKDFRCVPSGVPQSLMWNEACLDEPNEDNSPIIITEGECDALAFLQAGFQFVVSVPSGAKGLNKDGKPVAQNVHRYLAENGLDDIDLERGEKYILKPSIRKFQRIILATDADTNGFLLRDELAEFLGEEFCCKVEFPRGMKDANDLLEKSGVKALHRLVERALPIADDGYRDFADLAKGKSVATFSTGFPWLEPKDDHSAFMRLVSTEVMIIAGPAGSGKSTFMQMLVGQMAVNHGWKASIYHGEGEPEVLLRGMRKLWRRTIGNGSASTAEANAAREEWIRQNIGAIHDEESERTLGWLMQKIELQALHRKRKVFVIDPWNEVVLPEPRRGQNWADHEAECLSKLRALARRLDVVVIVVCHTRKLDNPDVPPTKDKIAGSASFDNKADHVVMVWQPPGDYTRARIEIAKSKDRMTMGLLGHHWVRLDQNTFSYSLTTPPFGHDGVPFPKRDDDNPVPKRKANGKGNGLALGPVMSTSEAAEEIADV